MRPMCCTRFSKSRLGLLSVRVGDSSRSSEETDKNTPTPLPPPKKQNKTNKQNKQNKQTKNKKIQKTNKENKDTPLHPPKKPTSQTKEKKSNPIATTTIAKKQTKQQQQNPRTGPFNAVVTTATSVHVQVFRTFSTNWFLLLTYFWSSLMGILKSIEAFPHSQFLNFAHIKR